MEKLNKSKLGKNEVITILRYYRKPLPQCNWCHRYSIAYRGKDVVEIRLDGTRLSYSKDKVKVDYAEACNVVHDFRQTLDWSQINDTGEIEIAVSEFNRLAKVFKYRVSEARAKE